MTTRTAYRTCPLCEAGCGLELTVTADDGTGAERVTRIRGDRDDVFSHGFICPKGSTLIHLHEDPDRLRRPLVRRDGELVEATWEEAWTAVADGLGRVIDAHGRAAVGLYVGNPNAHNIGAMAYLGPTLRAFGTPKRVLGQHGRPAAQGARGPTRSRWTICWPTRTGWTSGR